MDNPQPSSCYMVCRWNAVHRLNGSGVHELKIYSSRVVEGDSVQKYPEFRTSYMNTTSGEVSKIFWDKNPVEILDILKLIGDNILKFLSLKI